MPKAVIICAIQVEFVEIRRFLSDVKESIHPEGSVYEVGTFTSGDRSWEVLLVEAGMGNVDAALATSRALEFYKPDVLMLVGIAGGIKDVALGDVVAAPAVSAYERGKAEESFRPRPQVAFGNFALVERAKAEARREDRRWTKRISGPLETLPKAIVGNIVAGEKVVASDKNDVYKLLMQHFSDAVAVEMEGFGFYEAVHLYGNTKVPALIVRGISDLLTNKAESDGKGIQAVASRHAAAFAFEILSNFEPPTKIAEAASSPEHPLREIRSKLIRGIVGLSETLLYVYGNAKDVLPAGDVRWMRNELDGYSLDEIFKLANEGKDEFPACRMPQGELININPQGGRQKLRFEVPHTQETFSKMPIDMSINQIETVLADQGSVVCMALPTNLEQQLRAMMLKDLAEKRGRGYGESYVAGQQFVLQLPRITFTRILDHCRTRLLDLIDLAMTTNQPSAKEPEKSRYNLADITCEHL